jgi:hypothetical protein
MHWHVVYFLAVTGPNESLVVTELPASAHASEPLCPELGIANT